MVFEDLLHGLGQHRDGNPRGAAEDCNVYIYYMDIRTFGLLRGRVSTGRARKKHKVKYIKARIAEVTSDGKRLVVKGEDTLVKRPITIPFDMVVHAIGMDPNVDNMTLSAVFGVELNKLRLYRQGLDLRAPGGNLAARRVRRRRGHRAGNHRRFHRAGTGGGAWRR